MTHGISSVVWTVVIVVLAIRRVPAAVSGPRLLPEGKRGGVRVDSESR